MQTNPNNFPTLWHYCKCKGNTHFSSRNHFFLNMYQEVVYFKLLYIALFLDPLFIVWTVVLLYFLCMGNKSRFFHYSTLKKPFWLEDDGHFSLIQIWGRLHYNRVLVNKDSAQCLIPVGAVVLMYSAACAELRHLALEHLLCLLEYSGSCSPKREHLLSLSL